MAPQHPYKDNKFVVHAEGAPILFNSANWLPTVSAGRVFFLDGYMELLAYFNVPNVVGEMEPHLLKTDAATDDAFTSPILKAWMEKLGGKDYWDEPGPAQLRYVMSGEPLQFIKALQLALAIDAYQIQNRERLLSDGKAVIDIWNYLRCVPAYYRAELPSFDPQIDSKIGVFNKAYLATLSTEATTKFAEASKSHLRLNCSKEFLNEIAAGQSMTFELAKAMADNLSPAEGSLKIVMARRSGGGNIKPASKYIAFAPRDLPKSSNANAVSPDKS